MSSPDGLQYSHADFVARWMPSSHRAGVILSPSTDLAGALRHISTVGSSPMKPDDSFTSDFAPLPTSADSSCVDVSPSLGTDRPGNESQDLSLQVKLEQLRKWQQHMQEQLKAQQLEELLRLQAEQQRLLGRINGAQQSTEDDAGSSASPHPEIPEWPPPKHPTEVDHDSKEEDTLDCSNDQLEDTNTSEHFQLQENTLPLSNGAALANDQRMGNPTVSQEIPIKPGIGGYTKTFEELLEEQLMLEDQRQKAAQQQQNQSEAGQAPSKRPFLKRGEGLSRFTNKGRASFPKKNVKTDSKPQPQARVMSRSNSEPAAIQRGVSNCVQKLPVQRKTAVLNKENRLKGLISPPLNLRNEAKGTRTVLGSYQRLNTEGSGSPVDSRQTKQFQLQRVKDQTNRTGGPSAQVGRKPGPNDTKPNPVTKQVVVLGEQGSSKNSGLDVKTAEQRGRGGGDEGSVDSFELSFQEKLRQWECHRQLENVELGEFELLEQAADELSFSSNSSFVMKILQLDQQHKKVQAAQGLHQRRLSSTPIKSPPTKTLQRSSSDGLTPRSSSINSEASQRSEGTERQEDTGSEAVSSCVESETEDQEAAVASFPAPSERPYNKWTYQNKDSGRDSDVSQDGDEERDSVISNPDESTLMEDEEVEQGGVVFDDDDTWNDVDETLLHRPADSGRVSPVLHPSTVCVSPPIQTLVRKVAANKNVAFSNQEPNPPSPPPASQLMTKLFPSLNLKAQNAPLHPCPASSVAPQYEKQQNETNQQIQSKQLRERLVELEIEIERFKKENAALTKLRQENEKNQENLRKDCLEFEKTRSQELAKFEEYKKEETRKLQKERKLFEKHVIAARAIPDKKEREEIQALKQQLSSLQEELRRKESRWASMHNRQRQQIDSLSQENSSLKEEIKVLEKLRLSTLRKTSVSAEKETKDGPRMFSNIPTTVTKGVKFASPLDSRGSSSNKSPPQSSSAAAVICKRSTAESSQPASGMKSSLRRPSGPSILSSSSSSMPGRRTEERLTSANKSQDQFPKEDCLPSESECSTAEEAESVQEVFTFPDGKIEKVLTGGDRLIIFPNGTKKEVSADGLSVKVTFFNGDTKQIKADQTVIYHYSEAQTTHITYPDGLEVLHFPNNQTEKHFPDGRKEITFPDQTVKNLFPDGREESVLMDGTIIQVNPDGTKEIHFNTGQKEVHTPDYKRREYPDGTVKTVYTDGRQETHYPTGRVRIKDKDGNVIMDNSV